MYCRCAQPLLTALDNGCIESGQYFDPSPDFDLDLRQVGFNAISSDVWDGQSKVAGELAGLSRLRELSVSSTVLGHVLLGLLAQRPRLRVLRLPRCYLNIFNEDDERPAMEMLDALFEHLEVSHGI